MKWWEIIIHLIGIVFTYYAHIKAYSLIFKNAIRKFKIIDIFLILIIILVTYYNTFYNYGFSKIIISFLSIFMVLKIIYSESLRATLFKSLIIYFIGFIIEMALGMFMVYFQYDSLIQINNDIILKVLFSILMMLVMLLLSNIKGIKNICSKLYNVMDKIFNMMVLIILSIFVLVLLTYYLIISIDIYSIGAVISLIIILSLLIFIGISQSIKTKNAIDKQEILLDFMKEYEIIIDKERIDRHEMVNNLLVLKSIKNKNTKQYNKILDDILLTYQSNKTSKGLYELPSGLKGLFYYKIHDMKNKNIEVLINVSNKIIKDLDNLDSNVLTKVCKILGILLDNAKEAAYDSKEKLVVIDLYEEENNIIIYIENTISYKKIDFSKIKIKGFSTKGNNRGYGLYLVDRILNKTDKLKLMQEVNKNNFISILKIKK